jgi:cyclophilin family peptidyl-prolyl cis-trans isomerase
MMRIFCLLGVLIVNTFALWADTIVRFETTLGSFDVQLYDRDGATRTTPLTVENFLTYVRAGVYDGSFFHRSISDVIIQGGGFTFLPPDQALDLPANDPVQNEPGNSNVRGTIAMAKIGGQPNSATNQWYFNVSDNLGLDAAEEGYTVFGHVLGNGMEVVDEIASLTIYNVSSILGSNIFSTIPLLNGSILIVIKRISIVSFDTNQILSPLGTITLIWSAIGNLPVNVERATNLVTTDWQTIATGLTSGEFTDPNPPASGPVFYRVVKP